MRHTAPLVLILLLSIGVSAQGRDPVAGAWEALPNPNPPVGQTNPNPPLHLVYINGQYVQFTAAADRAKSQKSNTEMTKEELVDRLQMQGQYGTYRVEGNKLIRKTIAAAQPNNEGRETTQDFKVEGDILIVTGQNAQGQKTENRFKRLK